MSYIPREPVPHDVVVYRHDNGREPFTEWFRSLRGTPAQRLVRDRLGRVRDGRFGDYRALGNGVFELRIHFSPGIRIYFGVPERCRVIVLCGGSKNTQHRDIQRAREYWSRARGH